MSSHSSHHSSSHHGSSHHSSSHHSSSHHSSGSHGGGHKSSGGDLFTDLASGLIMAGVASSMEKKHHYSENGQINPYAVSAAMMASGRMRTTDDVLRTGAMLGAAGAFDDPPERRQTYTPTPTYFTYVPPAPRPRPQPYVPPHKAPAAAPQEPPPEIQEPELQTPDPLFAPGEDLVRLSKRCAWRMDCLDDTPYGLSPWNYSSRQDYDRAVAGVKAVWEAPGSPQNQTEPAGPVIQPWQNGETSQTPQTSASALRYCRVQLDNSQETVTYRTTDESLSLGDRVRVVWSDGTVAAGTIVGVEFCSENRASGPREPVQEIQDRYAGRRMRLGAKILRRRLTQDLRLTLQARFAQLQTLVGPDTPKRTPDADPTPEEVEHCVARTYARAQENLDRARCERDFWESAELFHAASGYRDAEEKCRASAHEAARLHRETLEAMRGMLPPPEGLAAVGEDYVVGVTSQGSCLLAARSNALNDTWGSVRDWTWVVQVASEGHTIVALRSDGRVETAGIRVSADWKNVALAACSSSHVVGLQGDGTVKAVGNSEDPRCRVQDWEQIIQVACTPEATVGLRADGTVVCAGGQDAPYGDLEQWSDVAEVLPGNGELLALKRDGTVLHGYDRDRVTRAEDGALSQWSRFVTAQMTGSTLVGLREDGSVWEYNTAAGTCRRQPWTDIIAIACTNGHYAGLRADGTVLLNFEGRYDQSKVEHWNNIIALAAGGDKLAGIRTDGTVLTTNLWLDTSSWKLFQHCTTLEEEQQELADRAQVQTEERTAQLEQELQEGQAELKRMSGFLYRLLVPGAHQKADDLRRRLTQARQELVRILGCVCIRYGDRLDLEE